MPTPTETVMEFLSMLEKPGGFPAAIRAFFTPESNYKNVGLSDTTGIEASVAFVEAFEKQTGISYMVVDQLTIAEAGDKVLTERIDRLYAADGREIMAPWVMGIFEVKDGKIAAWRDYFDTGAAVGQGVSG